MFELRDPIVRQVIFAMENQNIRYLMDMDKGQLVRWEVLPEEERPDDSSTIEPDARYQPLPGWSSADGFQLMEQFVAELHNPMVRDHLQEILVSGKRVFRRFKDAVKEHPEVERRFYSFKFFHMRDVVFEWYNALRELSGLEVVEVGVDEELDDLTMSNVAIHSGDGIPSQRLREWDERAFFEAYEDEDQATVRYLYRRRAAGGARPDDAENRVVAAYTPMEELCGFVWASMDRLDDTRAVANLEQVFVLPEYRGLGIGSLLVEHAVTRLKRAGVDTILVRFPGRSDPIYTLLERLGFRGIRRDFLMSADG